MPQALVNLHLQPLGPEVLNLIQAIFQVQNLWLGSHIIDQKFFTILPHVSCILLFNSQSILAEGDICASQRRASCEGIGLLARLGNDISTARMVSCMFLMSMHFLPVILLVYDFHISMFMLVDLFMDLYVCT